jgi:PD-(D/E)XK nuclease superfamily
MARRPNDRITSWSYSRYSTYKMCPLQAKLRYLVKYPEGPKGAALVRGDDVHKKAEAYLTGKTRNVPADLKNAAPELRALRDAGRKGAGVAVEETVALRSDWTLTTWDDWDGCWVRIKMDVRVADGPGPEVSITDWKTGRFREDTADDYMEQLDLYALGGLVIHAGDPDVVVRPRLIYTDVGYTHPRTPVEYTLADLPRLKAEWERRVRPMMNDRTFAPKPNRFCNWCAFGVSKGGPCRYG